MEEGQTDTGASADIATEEPVTTTTVLECVPEPLRKPSSRRKKKWRRRLAKEEYDAPFSHLESLDTDPVEVMKDVAQLRHESCDIKRTVATLSQLCLTSLHQKNISDIAAPGVQKLVKVYNYNQSIRSLQLAWLHKMLQTYELCAATGTPQSYSYNPSWIAFINIGASKYAKVYKPLARPLWSDIHGTGHDVNSNEHASQIIPVTELRHIKNQLLNRDCQFTSVQNISGTERYIMFTVN